MLGYVSRFLVDPLNLGYPVLSRSFADEEEIENPTGVDFVSIGGNLLESVLTIANVDDSAAAAYKCKTADFDSDVVTTLNVLKG